MPDKIKVAILGTGGMAQYHIRLMLQQVDSTQILVVSEPSTNAYAAAAKLFIDNGFVSPPNQPDLEKLLAEYGSQLDTVFIITPHVFHYDQTKACLEAGLDVLLEKPIV